MPQNALAFAPYVNPNGQVSPGKTDVDGAQIVTISGTASSLNVVAGSVVLKATPGRMGKIMINTAGSALAWAIHDCATVGAIAVGNLVWSGAFGAANVIAGGVVTLDFPCLVGIVLTVPTSGVASVSWT